MHISPVPMKDQRIKITSCDVTNCYKDKDGNLQFTKNPQYVVFGYELQESQGASANVPYNPYDNGVNFEDLSSDSSIFHLRSDYVKVEKFRNCQ